MFQLFTVISFFTLAQNGTIKGLVTDLKTKEPLVGATVMFEGTTIGSITDFDGNYIIEHIPPGTYKLRCSFISYETKILPNVKIEAGKNPEFNFELGESTIEIGGVEVVAKVNRQSESMLLIEQKNSVVAVQAIGAQEISRKGASDAEGAVAKMSGISKQEGVKNVFVRGLGDRFNATSLNGFPIPSEDPEYKNISLDFFASDMIQAVGVNKVFGSRMNGDVGGAEINILSKKLTGDSDLGFDISGGINIRTISEKFLKPDGVGALGYANNKPGPTDLSVYGFKNSLDPSQHQLRPNQSFSLSGGKNFLTGASKSPLSFYLIGSYSANYNYVNGVVRNTTTTGTVFQDQDFDKYSQNTSHLVMANLDCRHKKQTVSYNGLYIHTNVQSVGDYLGLNAVFEDTEDYQGFLRRQQVNDNSLIINQIFSEWKLSGRWALKSGVSVNCISGNEPDRRMNYLSSEGNGMYYPTKGTGRQQRYFSSLSENDYNLKIEAVYNLDDKDNNQSSIHFGYNGRMVARSFEAIEYDQQVVNQPHFRLDALFLDQYYNQGHLGNDDFMLDRNRDEYSVDKYVNSVYGEIVSPLGNRLVGIAGLRADKVNMGVDCNVNRGGTQGKTEIDDLYFLPFLNLKYDITAKSALRVGASRTYTLPQAKEISPFRYVDVSFRSQGNPELKSSVNNNIDLKWDYYISSDEILTLTGFCKYIIDPISRIEKASAGGFLSYDNIADKATVAGIEMEVRKTVFRTDGEESGKADKLSVGINASYLITDVKLQDANFTNRTSQLEGAAPVIINSDLSYFLNRNNFSLTSSLVFNYFSDRVYTIGTQGYQDIMEEGIPTLDFVASAKINKHWGLSFKAKNLLDPEFRLTRNPNGAGMEPIVLSNYKKGILMSFGISFNW